MSTQIARATQLKKIEEVIQKSSRDEQRQLLAALPHLLRFDFSNIMLLKAAEPAFDFWNNPDDIIYDNL